MKLKSLFSIYVLCGSISLSAQHTSGDSATQSGGRENHYNNPVINYSLPDPTVIKGDDGYYYLYATENIKNVPIHRSKDLVHWEMVGTAFTDNTRPTFVSEGRIWAPDINKIGDKYVMYYSMSTWGGEWTCGIGIAVADRPEGPFKDLGKLFLSNEINIQNCIDPFYIEDKGKKYLFWGSFHGLYGTELTEDGLSLKKDTPVVLIQKNDAFVGPGHNSELITDKKGNDWMFYHAVSVANPEGRVLMMDCVRWKKGWPSVENATPSLEAAAPKL